MQSLQSAREDRGNGEADGRAARGVGPSREAADDLDGRRAAIEIADVIGDGDTKDAADDAGGARNRHAGRPRARRETIGLIDENRQEAAERAQSPPQGHGCRWSQHRRRAATDAKLHCQGTVDGHGTARGEVREGWQALHRALLHMGPVDGHGTARGEIHEGRQARYHALLRMVGEYGPPGESSHTAEGRADAGIGRTVVRQWSCQVRRNIFRIFYANYTECHLTC